MKVETWSRVSALFQQALAFPPGERAAFLDQASAGELEVRAEVERLLQLDRAPGEPFGSPSVLRAAAWSPGPGDRVGRYTIVRTLASGGMGTVFEAVQDQPRRTVALKTLRVGLTSPEHLQRFLFEVEVLGRLRDPAIAQVYEAGVHDEGGELVPFFAMELVAEARDIVSYAHEQGLSLAQRLELFLQVLAAVHHGHQKGVIHRDLKAANLLVGADGRPKVIDFGVARASGVLERRDPTRAGELVGTLATMSPEQLAGDPREVDARSDVYSLGVVLYELVGGRPPYDLAGLALEQALQRLRAPIPAREKHVPLELHWILTHALETEPARRYASVVELAEDIRRFLTREPVSVGPPGVRYRFGKIARRHRVLLTATGAVVAALSFGLVRAERSARAEARQRGAAEREALRAWIVGDTLERILTSPAPGALGRGVFVEDVLGAAARSIEEVAVTDPVAAAALHRMVGSGYAALRRTDEARVHLSAARDFARAHLEPDDPQALAIGASWADLLVCDGEPAPAAELARELLPSAERRFGAADRRTTSLRRTLAAALYDRYRLDEAEAVARENLRCLRLDARDGASECAILLQLASIALRRALASDVARAREWAEEALLLCEELLPPEDLRTLEARQLLAMIATAEGRYAEARSALEAAFSAGRADMAESGCARVAALMHDGFLAFTEGDHEAAFAAFVEARADADVLLGPESLVAIQARNGLSLACAELGRSADAVCWAEEALALAVQTLSATHPTTLKVRAALAFAWSVEGRPSQAEVLFRELLPEAEAVFGAGHPFVLEILAALAESLSVQGDLAGLEDLAAEVADRIPADDPHAVRVESLLAAMRSPAASDGAAEE